MKKTYKYFSPLLLIFIFQISFAQNNLHKIIDENYLYMNFVSDSEGWLVSPDHIKKTFDGGNTWELKLTLDTETYYTDYIKQNGIHFLDGNTGYFVLFTKAGNRYFLFKTTDGGTSWEQRSILLENITNNDVSHLTFLNENYGWARYNFNKLIRTTNGGLTWDLLSVDLGNVYKIKFVNELVGYYYTTAGLFKTTDGGYIWSQLNTGLTYHWDFDVVGDNIWIGSDGVYFSSNSGESFSKISSDITFGNVSSFSFFDENHGYMKNNSSSGFYTSDGGVNWIQKVDNYSGLFSFFDQNNGWYFENRNLKKATDNFNSSELVLPDMEFSDVTFADNIRIIASSYNGAIMYSNDGGKTWTINLDLYGKYRIEDLCFGDGGLGIAVGWYSPADSPYTNGFIAKTNDFGENWEVVLDVNEPFGTFIESADYSEGKYFVKSTGRIITSDNLALNWSIDSTDYGGASFTQTDFIGNTGFAIPNYGNQTLMKTTNGGVGWSSTADENANSVYFVAEDCIWADFGSTIMKSTNQGQTWIDTELDFNQIYFKTKNLGVGFGYLNNTDINTQGVYLTEDGGENWAKLTNNYLSYTDWAIDFISGTKGFFADQRDLYTTLSFGNVDSVVSVERNNLSEIPSEFSLSQNYPNPFNPTTIIKYSVPSNEYVSLKIYDVLGKEVVTLVNQEMNAGSYEVQFDASQFTSGVYIYRLITEDLAITKKMILIK